MGSFELGRLVVAALLTGVLAWASFTDIRDRRIRNVTVLAVLGLFGPWALMMHSGLDVLLALGAGVVALAVGIALYAVGWMGAGDAKLIGAAALFVGWHHLIELMVMTTLVGGLIALFSLISQPKRTWAMITRRDTGQSSRGVPYGVAIAAATLILTWSSLLHMALPLTGAVKP